MWWIASVEVTTSNDASGTTLRPLAAASSTISMSRPSLAESAGWPGA
jgi:hypothetical protein